MTYVYFVDAADAAELAVIIGLSVGLLILVILLIVVIDRNRKKARRNRERNRGVNQENDAVQSKLSVCH